MKTLTAVATFAGEAAALAIIVWIAHAVGYWEGAYYLPPQPTLTEAEPNTGEASRIQLDLMQIREIIEKHPDGFWAKNYADWFRGMEADAKMREESKAEHQREEAAAAHMPEINTAFEVIVADVKLFMSSDQVVPKAINEAAFADWNAWIRKIGPLRLTPHYWRNELAAKFAGKYRERLIADINVLLELQGYASLPVE